MIYIPTRSHTPLLISPYEWFTDINFYFTYRLKYFFYCVIYLNFSIKFFHLISAYNLHWLHQLLIIIYNIDVGVSTTTPYNARDHTGLGEIFMCMAYLIYLQVLKKMSGKNRSFSIVSITIKGPPYWWKCYMYNPLKSRLYIRQIYGGK